MHVSKRVTGRASVLVAAPWAALALSAPPAATEPAARTAPAPVAQPPPDASLELSSLRAAFLSGAPDELARAGQRLPSHKLAAALAGDDRELALAAAGAAPSAPDAIWLLVPLGELARSPDRPMAAAAVRAAARIAGSIDLDALLDGDVPLDWVRARLTEYRAQAADPGRWTDVRVSSLEVAAHLGRALGERARPADAAYDLAAVLADPEPEVRRAALELTVGPLQPEQARLIAAHVASDDDGAVVAAAAQALCDGLAFGDAAAPVLAALGEHGVSRLRALVVDTDQPHVARAAAGRCLAADDSAESRAALRQAGDLEPDEEAAAAPDGGDAK